MNWKTAFKLRDLDPDAAIEVTCRKCGKSRYEQAQILLSRSDLRHAYLDEVEDALHCRDRFCTGKVRVALIYDHLNEGFVNGLP